MKEKLVVLLVILCFSLALGWGLNHALSYYDPPKKFKWVEYKVPQGGKYLSQVASKLSNQFGKHPSTLVEIMYEKNHLKDYYLPGGETILILGR